VADKVAASLGGEVGSSLGPIKGRLLSEARGRAPANLSPYDSLLLAREQSILGTKEAIAKGREYIDRAIALDPNLAHAYAIRGWLKWQTEGPFAAKVKEMASDFRLSLGLDPSNYSAQAGLILYSALMGQWPELAADIERAMRDNPTNTLVLQQAALQLPYLGRPEEGAKTADLVLY
jgi:adenylate cyclase